MYLDIFLFILKRKEKKSSSITNPCSFQNYPFESGKNVTCFFMHLVLAGGTSRILKTKLQNYVKESDIFDLKCDSRKK